MERNLQREIENQFKNNLNKTELLLFNETNKFQKLKDHYTSILKQTFAEHKEKIQKEMTGLATKYTDKTRESPAKYKIPRPGQFEKQNYQQRSKKNQQSPNEQNQNFKLVQYVNEDAQQYDDVNEPGKPYDFPT